MHTRRAHTRTSANAKRKSQALDVYVMMNGPIERQSGDGDGNRGHKIVNIFTHKCI